MSQYDQQNARLFERLYAGDPSAREELILLNTPLAIGLAHRVATRNRHLDLDDLIQRATEGLIKAIDRFDPTRKLQLSTFATTIIRSELQMESFASRTYYVDRNTRGTYEAAVTRAGGYDADSAAIAAASNSKNPLTIEQVDALKRTAQPHSLDAPVSDTEGSATLGELATADTNELELVVARLAGDAQLASLLIDISQTQQVILQLRYGIGFDDSYSWSAISQLVGIPVTDVCRLEREAMRTLHAAHADEPPVEYPPIDRHAAAGINTPGIPTTPAIARNADQEPQLPNANERKTGRGLRVAREPYVFQPGELPSSLIGAIVDRLAQARNMTMEQVAHDSGVHIKRLYEYRSHRSWSITLEAADALLRALDAQALWHAEPLASYLEATWNTPASHRRTLTNAELQHWNLRGRRSSLTWCATHETYAEHDCE